MSVLSLNTRITSITEASTKSSNASKVSNSYARSGVPYNKLGERKDIMSLGDSQAVAQNILNRGSKNALIRMAHVKEDGTAIKGSTMEFNGQTYFSDDKGVFNTLDGDVLMDRKQARLAHEETLNQLVSLVSAS
jgi:hypothetical protein